MGYATDRGSNICHRIARCALIILALLGPGASSVRADGAVSGEIVVELRPDVSITDFTQTFHTPMIAQLPGTRLYRLALPAGVDPNTFLQSVAGDARVVATSGNDAVSHPEAATSSPTFGWTSGFNGDGPLAYAGQTGVSLVNYTDHTASRSTGAGTIVAVLDTGISLRNPALASHVLAGWNAIDGSASTDDAPAGVDSNGDGIFDEAAGHGTMVAGIINRFAPQAQLLPVKVLDSDGHGTVWSVIAGIYYAASQGAKVVNISIGIPQKCVLLDRAIRAATSAGVLIVTSAGNDDAPINQYPAADPVCVTVSSVNYDETKAIFANYGNRVDLDAPGVDVVSVYWDGSYRAWSGTSFSAPFVAAEAALIRSLRPAMDPGAVTKQLTRHSHSVDPYNPLYRNDLGKGQAGLIDFDWAVSDL